MKYFIKTSDNARILVEDLNSDSEKTILFIHGWPLNHTAFEYQLDFFPDKGYRCVAVDLRGFGESDRPYNNYDYDTMASDIKKVIDVLNLKNITLVVTLWVVLYLSNSSLSIIPMVFLSFV